MESIKSTLRMDSQITIWVRIDRLKKALDMD
jgi:hypothetical protein